MSSPSAPYHGMSDLALLLVGPCLEIGGPGMYPPVADLMYLSSVTAGDLDLESRKMGSVKGCPNDQMILMYLAFLARFLDILFAFLHLSSLL